MSIKLIKLPTLKEFRAECKQYKRDNGPMADSFAQLMVAQKYGFATVARAIFALKAEELKS